MQIQLDPVRDNGVDKVFDDGLGAVREKIRAQT